MESTSHQVSTAASTSTPIRKLNLTKVFRISLERRPFGLKIESDVLLFDANAQQCNLSGSPIEDSDYTFNPQKGTIEAIVNPDSFGLSEHRLYPLITGVDFSLLWTDVQNGQNLTLFTRLEPIAYGLLTFISQLLLNPS